MAIEHQLGLTPIIKRLAYFYLTKGFGSFPIAHPDFDEVRVRELYPYSSPKPELPPQGGILVEFLLDNQRLRWVEFGCQFIGGGGEPILQEV